MNDVEKKKLEEIKAKTENVKLKKSIEDKLKYVNKPIKK